MTTRESEDKKLDHFEKFIVERRKQFRLGSAHAKESISYYREAKIGKAGAVSDLLPEWGRPNQKRVPPAVRTKEYLP